MPLVLSLKKSQDFYVGDERFVVTAVTSQTTFTLRHDQSGKVFKVTDAKQVEVAPQVWVSAGEKPEAMVARVSIEAPISMLIIRGDKKRNPPTTHKEVA